MRSKIIIKNKFFLILFIRYLQKEVLVTVINKHFALDENDFDECVELIQALYELIENKEEAPYPVFKLQGSASSALYKRKPYLELEGRLKGTFKGKRADQKMLEEQIAKGERNFNLGPLSLRIKDFALILNFLLARLLHAIWPLETHSLLRADPTHFLFRNFHEMRYIVIYGK